jgi:hypothetical protein
MPLPVDVAPLSGVVLTDSDSGQSVAKLTAPSNPYWGTKLWIDHKLAMLVNEPPFASLVVAT